MANETAENGFRQANADRTNPPYFNDKNAVMKASFSITAGTALSNICNVQITVSDSDLLADTTVQPFKVWLSDSAVGLGLTAVTASGTVAGTVGNDFFDYVAKKLKLVQPTALGVYTLEITDSAKTGFYIAVQNQFTGQVIVSRQLLTADYG